MSGKAKYLLPLALSLCACGGGGSDDDGGDTPPVVENEALGGIWVGSDSQGLDVYALSTDAGEIHWVAPETGEQGFGTGSVSGSDLTINYTYVVPFGYTLSDGSTSASCAASGTLQERQALSVTVNCSSSGGASFSNSASLTYSTLYDRNSSLETISGIYDDDGIVLSVASNGEIFEQDPGTGCVINGQVNVIDSNFNAYGVSVTYSSCTGDLSVVNGATFEGLATLDNTASPEYVIAALTGSVDGITYSVTLSLPRT